MEFNNYIKIASFKIQSGPYDSDYLLVIIWAS